MVLLGAIVYYKQLYAIDINISYVLLLFTSIILLTIFLISSCKHTLCFKEINKPFSKSTRSLLPENVQVFL